MQSVPDASAAVPTLAEYPSTETRQNLPPAEWQACLDSWLLSVELRLRLNDDLFSVLVSSKSSTEMKFLRTYCLGHDDNSLADLLEREALLHRRVYLLLRRTLITTDVPASLTPDQLINLLLLATKTFKRVPDWHRTLQYFEKQRHLLFSAAMNAWKSSIMRDLHAADREHDLSDLHQMKVLVRLLPQTGVALMTGSDYLETLIASFKQSLGSQTADFCQETLTEHLYCALKSLIAGESNQTSLLLDHLYLLQAASQDANRTGKSPQQRNVLSSLLCTTSFLRVLLRDPAIMSTSRGQGLVETLSTLRDQHQHLYPMRAAKKGSTSKGKAKARSDDGIHIHAATQISQIHDLFPDLSTSYILQLLDHFQDNTEDVTAALLEPESLPPFLHKENSNGAKALNQVEAVPDLAPRSSPPQLSQRRNMFDNNDFDKLSIAPGQLHRGRKDMTVETTISEEDHTRSKAAIMAALAAFDSDDDERDDTYDVADVGGSVDQSVDTDSRARVVRQSESVQDESLYGAWKANPELFGRDSRTRSSLVRQDLKRQTGMSDEQLEGWAIMLGRNKALQERLEKKYSDVGRRPHVQRFIGQTKWQQNSSQESSADEGEFPVSDGPDDGRRMGQAQIRGSRNWGRGRGGNTSGPASDSATQAARRRKEQGRGRGGGQNKREGRARKMGRGMAGAPSA